MTIHTDGINRLGVGNGRPTVYGGADATLFTKGGTLYAHDAEGDLIDSGDPLTDFASVFQTALSGLKSGRSHTQWVRVLGDYTLKRNGATQLLVDSYTGIDLRGARLRLADSINQDVLTNADPNAGNTMIHILGGIIDANKAGQTSGNGHTINLNGVTYASVAETRVLNPRGIGVLTQSQFVTSQGVHLERVIVDGSGTSHGVQFSDASYVSVTHSRLRNNYLQGVFGRNANMIDVSHNTFESNGQQNGGDGGAIGLNGEGTALGARLIGNDIDGADLWAGSIEANQQAETIIIGNRGRRLSIGISIGSFSHRSRAEANILQAATDLAKVKSSGVSLEQSNDSSLIGNHAEGFIGQAYTVNGGSNLTIKGNTGKNTRLSGGIADGFILNDVTGTRFIGNRAYDDQGTPTQKNGLKLAGTTGNIVIDGNDLRGNLERPILLVGTGHVIGRNDGVGLYATDDTSTSLTGSVAETNLKTSTLLANALMAGLGVRIKAAGTIAGTNGQKNIKLVLGNTTLGEIVENAGETSDWLFEVDVRATSSTDQRIARRLYQGSALESVAYLTASESLSVDRTLKITGQLANAADTITQTMWHVETIA